ncbi:MAG: redoxin family protein [Patescibacteria group bacterium]
MDATNTQKSVIIVALIAAVIGGIVYLNSQKAPRDTIGGKVEVKPAVGKEEKAKLYPVAKEITTPDGFINTSGAPITVGEFVGKKVVLVDFWTYSCINCQRTTPYLNAWYEKYKDKGLIIIGLHTPEFEFEKKYDNVLAAVKKFNIKYPVVLDNDFSTWNAYQNRFWPRKYLVDIDGYVVYDHIGEGGYEETERKIQELLAERAVALKNGEKIASEVSKPAGAEEGGALKPRSPEIYFGAARNLLLGNGVPERPGTQKLAGPTNVKTNVLYLAGTWDFSEEFAENKSAGAKITFRYQGKNVFFVASAPQGVNIKVLRDGVALIESAGADVIKGILTVKEDRLYEIVKDANYGEHTLELIIEDPGLRAYTFTFG